MWREGLCLFLCSTSLFKTQLLKHNVKLSISYSDSKSQGASMDREIMSLP